MNYPNNRSRVEKWILLYVFSFFLFFFSLVIPKVTLAAVRCETQYGGTQVCVTTGQLQIDKEIYDPQNKKYVDNLGINDYRFSPGELISFRLSIKNVGDATLGNVAVSDTPQAGFLDLATGALNFNLTNLAPGETRQQELRFKVVDASKFPQNNVICIVNAAEANADNSHDRDTSQICLERKVLAVETKGGLPQALPKELPKTGPEGLLLGLVGSVAGLVTGMRLMRVGKIQSDAFETNYFLVLDRIIRKERGC